MARPTKPKVDSFGSKELDRAQEKFESFQEEIKTLTQDKMNEAPKEETEPQTKMTAEQWKKADEIYLKPKRVMPPSANPKGINAGKLMDVFNEKFRDQYNYDKTYVRFIAENNEIIGETIHTWTRPYPGIPAEEWEVPVNKPVWGPRYLAEQIKRKCYHVLSMNDHQVTGQDQVGSYTGGIVVKNTKQRLDARSAPKEHFAFNRKVSSF